MPCCLLLQICNLHNCVEGQREAGLWVVMQHKSSWPDDSDEWRGEEVVKGRETLDGRWGFVMLTSD